MYIVSTMLLGAIAEKCGWESYQIMRSLDGEHLKQVEYQHPFCARTGKLFPAILCGERHGTGFVHIAPGHGLEDYALGLEHGLPIYSPVDDDGKFAYTKDLPQEQQMPSHLIGKSILEKNNKCDANEAVLELLKGQKCLCTRRIIRTAIRSAGGAKRRSFFGRWTSGSLKWITGVSARRRCKRLTRCVGAGLGQGAHRSCRAEPARLVYLAPADLGRAHPAFYDAEGHPILDARMCAICRFGRTAWIEYLV